MIDGADYGLPGWSIKVKTFDWGALYGVAASRATKDGRRRGMAVRLVADDRFSALNSAIPALSVWAREQEEKFPHIWPEDAGPPND